MLRRLPKLASFQEINETEGDVTQHSDPNRFGSRRYALDGSLFGRSALTDSLASSPA